MERCQLLAKVPAQLCGGKVSSHRWRVTIDLSTDEDDTLHLVWDGVRDGLPAGFPFSRHILGRSRQPRVTIMYLERAGGL